MQRYKQNEHDPGVAYASYYFIERCKTESETTPSGLYFNKALSFINTEMKRRKQNIKVPHCWYRWGDEVVRYFMPVELAWSHEEAGYTKVDWIGHPPKVEESKADLIKILIDEFLYKYPMKNKDWYEELLADHYDTAPFEFQKTFKVCRDILFDRIKSNTNNEVKGGDVLQTLFENAFKSFPNDKLFSPVKAFIPTFLKLIAYPLSGSRQDMSIVNDLSEEFWYWFAYFLRVHPSAHENVDQETIAYWRSLLVLETSHFYRNFDDYVYRLSLKYPEIAMDDLLAPRVIETRERQQKWESEAADFEEITRDLDIFLSDKIDMKKNSSN